MPKYEATHAYIGRKACGCAVAAAVDMPELQEETAKSVAEFIKGGLRVERIPLGDVGVQVKRCRCGVQQNSLFEEAA